MLLSLIWYVIVVSLLVVKLCVSIVSLGIWSFIGLWWYKKLVICW